MRRGLAAAARGVCTCRLVAGSHGVGKTRLLQAAVDEAVSQDFVVLRAVAYQSDANVPYSVVSEALSPIVREMEPNALRTLTRGADAALAHIIPMLSPSSERSSASDGGSDLTPRLRWHAAQFLTRLSARTPLLLTVDNAHWADPSSVALLHFVLRHASDARLMIAAAFNPLEAEAASPVRALTKAVADVAGSEVLTLEPLTEADLREWLALRFDIDASRVRDFAAFLYARTLGNPFFVDETIKTLIQRGRLRQVDNRWVGWDVEDIDVPATIREVILERVDTLSPPARAIADLASVIGSRVSHDLLRNTSLMDPAAFLSGADELRRAAVITEIEEGSDIVYDFTHPLLQRTLYEEVGAGRRRELHGLIAHRLEERFGPEAEQHATELAFHYVRAGTPGLASKSVRYLRLAGQNALVMRADREAARYLQHGLDLIDRGSLGDENLAAIPELVEDLARARQRLGEYDASRVLWMRARDLHAASSDRAALARTERRLGLLSFWSGDPHQAIAHYDTALAHARAAGSGDTEGRALAGRGIALMALGMPDEAKREVHAALEVAERLGDVGLRGRVQRALLILYAYAGPADVANGIAKRVLEDANAAGDLALAWGAHHATAVLACFTANASVVAHHVAEADRIAKALHSPLLAAQSAEVALEYASAKGDWAEGLALAERAIPVARAMSPRSLLPRLLVWMGTILLNRDEIERAKACFDEAWEISRAGSTDSSGADLNAVIVAHIGQVAYAMTTREWLTAIEFAQRGVSIADRHGMTSWTLHRLLPMLAEAAVWVGDFTLATSAAARLRADAVRFEHVLDEAWAFTVEQLVFRWRDNQPGVVERLLAAADTFEAVPLVFHAARLRRHIARLLTLDGDRDGAARELRRAHDTFLRLGAALELRLTRESMRELGLRPPQQTVVQGGTLTQREREIAELVALHKTNKEIARALDISARTVSTHLSNVFQKLGVDSRGALADLVRSDPDLGRVAEAGRQSA
jgi:DNA-binding CsgD family transcriptional regulator